MVKSRRKVQIEDDAAAWLCDEFGDEGDELKDWRIDARDFIKFMYARGWEFRPTVMIIRDQNVRHIRTNDVR